MSQGLCRFDAQARIVVANSRYIEMYSLSPKIVRAGLHAAGVDPTPQGHRAVLRRRRRLLCSPKTPDARRRLDLDHEDVTEQRRAEEERAAIQSLEKRRTAVESAIASFRPLAARLLGSVSECAAAKRMTANTLFDESNSTSKQAESAGHAFNEASSDVESAAVAADDCPAQSPRSAVNSPTPAASSTWRPTRHARPTARSRGWRVRRRRSATW